MTFLEIAQAVTSELGLPYITDVADSGTPGSRQLAFLINRSGDEIYQAHPWVVSQDQHIVEIGSPIITVGDIAVREYPEMFASFEQYEYPRHHRDSRQ